MVSNEERSEIAFFDVETTVPTRPGQRFGLLEFGSILVCPKKLVELESYSTLVQPSDLSLISSLSVRCNGISRDAVVSAPTFAQIADRVYDILHGRIWAGHNILRFDCARIREAFAEINRPAPEPKGTIDSLALLTQKFGRRAGDMKMASLATYFGLGAQTHRSLDDVRMNLEVLKYCATVLFLESSLPDILTTNSWISPNATTRSRSNGKASREATGPSKSSLSPSAKIEVALTSSPTNNTIEENHPILSLMTPGAGEEAPYLTESDFAQPNTFDMHPLRGEVQKESLQPDDTMEEESGSGTPESSPASASEASSGCTEFLNPEEISISSVSAVLVPFYRGQQRIQMLHEGSALQICCNGLKVRFGLSTKFVDHAGRPRLSFVVDASPNLCRVLDACDNLAQRLSMDSGSSSDWRAIVTRKAGFWNLPTIRLHLPTIVVGDTARWITEIYQNESRTSQRLVFSRYDVEELDALFIPGTSVDAYFSLDPYDYQQNAGIRLVAKKLILQSN
ncbi:hypothetical protein RJ639_000786 [Escallonia herrerae]|uniref:Exonuclease domain-containing protein n=1 Tax=Escallonia herrerae TaxID=1293975 RepID=A0AA88XHB8_9ASTE|nr:hypothetical protein RJ639_000786 [Escallonia herrerae]